MEYKYFENYGVFNYWKNYYSNYRIIKIEQSNKPGYEIFVTYTE